MAERLENILDECLERLRQGDSVEQCLARYPEQAAELEPLLRVATASQKASSAVEPRPEFKARARYEIQSQLHHKERKTQPKKASFVGWMPRWAVVVASVVLIFLVAGTSTVAASSSSMPDDTLYPVKLATERVRLGLSRGDIKKARVNVRLADRRVKEIVYLAKKGDSRRLERALLRLEGHLEAIEQVIEANADNPKVQEAMTALKALLEERTAENEVAIEGATNNTDDTGILERVLERYRQRCQSALGSGWRGSR
jgi:DNA-binding FrmR family transcriptional regulator